VFSDVSAALQLLEGIQQSIQTCDDPKLEAHASADLNLLISVLENPVFRGICTMQVCRLNLLLLSWQL
jgi:hypothetical protein